VTGAGSAFKSLEYPFSSHYLNLDDATMHYVDEGKGYPTLLLHGNPTWSFYYRNLINVLKVNYRCIAPDHIGCGLSDKPSNYDYTLEKHIGNIEKLINSLKIEKFNLIVHDWGGAIGMGVATKSPDKINSIVILNSGAFTFDFIPFRIAICKIPFFGEIAIRQFNLFVQAARYMATTQKGGLKGEVLRGYLFPYNNYKNRIAIHRFVQDIPMKPSHKSFLTLHNIEKGLGSLKNKKIVFIWGAKDFCFNTRFLKRWKEFFPNANDFVFEHAGHYVLEDASSEVIEKIQSNL